MDNIFNEIPYEAFFGIYLLVASNFLAELFGCKLRYYLNQSMLIKHITGFIIFSLLVVLINIKIQNNNDIIKALGYSTFFYIMFILSTKTHIYITLFIIFLFMIMYIITFKIKDLEKKKELNNNIIKKLKLANMIILISTIIIIIMGAINYLFLKMKEQKQKNIKFSYSKFILGNQKCRNNKIEKIY